MVQDSEDFTYVKEVIKPIEEIDSEMDSDEEPRYEHPMIGER